MRHSTLRVSGSRPLSETCATALALALATGCSSSASTASNPDGGESGDDASVAPLDGGGRSDSSVTEASTDAGSTEGGTLPPTSGLTKVATGEYETFYLVDGVVYGYGGGTELLGVGPNGPATAIPPVPIASPAGLKFADVVGGLHQSLALDVNGNVWTWGDPGPSGTGITTGLIATPTQIMTDTLGNPFTHVIAIAATNNSTFNGYDAAIKDDGTVWVWGDCTGGVSGDGTGGATYLRPTQVPLKLPTGVKAIQIGVAYSVDILASDGTVWAWGGNAADDGSGTTNDPNNPNQVQGLPTTIKQIAIGAGSYALAADGELYGWGAGNGYLGIPGYAPQTTAIPLRAALGLPSPVQSIATSSLTSHAILTDGSLWSWGSAGCGGIGNGEEPFWGTCGWDFMSYDMMFYKAVRIVPTVSNFKTVFANSAFDFYIYALTQDGHLYSWGRNKTGTLGNGVAGATPNGNSGSASDLVATYPNSWDVPLATEVSPMTLTKATLLDSPCCIANPCALDCGPSADAGCPVCVPLADGGYAAGSGCPPPVGMQPAPDGGLGDGGL